jgi:hypothetical protein
MRPIYCITLSRNTQTRVQVIGTLRRESKRLALIHYLPDLINHSLPTNRPKTYPLVGRSQKRSRDTMYSLPIWTQSPVPAMASPISLLESPQDDRHTHISLVFVLDKGRLIFPLTVYLSSQRRHKHNKPTSHPRIARTGPIIGHIQKE